MLSAADINSFFISFQSRFPRSVQHPCDGSSATLVLVLAFAERLCSCGSRGSTLALGFYFTHTLAADTAAAASVRQQRSLGVGNDDGNSEDAAPATETALLQLLKFSVQR